MVSGPSGAFCQLGRVSGVHRTGLSVGSFSAHVSLVDGRRFRRLWQGIGPAAAVPAMPLTGSAARQHEGEGWEVRYAHRRITPMDDVHHTVPSLRPADTTADIPETGHAAAVVSQRIREALRGDGQPQRNLASLLPPGWTMRWSNWLWKASTRTSSIRQTRANGSHASARYPHDRQTLSCPRVLPTRHGANERLPTRLYWYHHSGLL